MRIGFLINHYDIHQVPHVAPFAFELSRRHPEQDVTILCSSARIENFARRIGTIYPGHRVKTKRLRTPPWIWLAGLFKSDYELKRKVKILKWNTDRLRRFDLLCAPELTSSRLRKHPEFRNTRLVFTCHGAGDNRNGAPFDPRIGKFDLAMLPGRKYARGLTELGFLRPDQFALAGYPKLDVMRAIGGARRSFFGNNKPVVLYNPHQGAASSSWNRCGEDVLRFFLETEAYNLLFAPHVLLVKKERPPKALLDELVRTGRCVVDLGSDLSSDMTYVRSADIYLGDQSSQIYEFLETPRPSVFLNPDRLNWKGDPSFLQWTFGRVIDKVSDLRAALDAAAGDHPAYRPAQEKALADTFEMPPEGAAARGADIIHRFATTGSIDPAWR